MRRSSEVQNNLVPKEKSQWIYAVSRSEGDLDPLVALRLHAVDAVVIHELLEVVQVVPPLEEEGLGDEAEPRRDQELAALGLLQHLLQLLLAHVAVALDLVGVRAQLHVLLRERRRTKMLRVKMSFCLYVCVRDGRCGLKVLARSFLASAQTGQRGEATGDGGRRGACVEGGLPSAGRGCSRSRVPPTRRPTGPCSGSWSGTSSRPESPGVAVGRRERGEM